MSGVVIIDEKLGDTLLAEEENEAKPAVKTSFEEEVNWILLKLHLEVFHTLSR